MTKSNYAIPLRREASNLQRLLASTLEVFEEQAKALDVDLRLEASAGVPAEIVLDPEKIAWVVATLVGNSLRYVRRGTRRMPGGAITVKLGYDEAADTVTIAVADDGPGIPKQRAASLFERAPGATHAAGLALMLIRDIVSAHGGTISVESSTDSVDHGTSITFRLPAD